MFATLIGFGVERLMVLIKVTEDFTSSTTVPTIDDDGNGSIEGGAKELLATCSVRNKQRFTVEAGMPSSAHQLSWVLGRC